MKLGRLIVVLIFFLLIQGLLVSADTDTLFTCIEDADCSFLIEGLENYYCNQETLTCYLLENEPIPVLISSTTSIDLSTLSLDERVYLLEESILTIQEEMRQMISENALTKNDLTFLKKNLDVILNDLNALKQQLDLLPPEVKIVSTGLAGLQQNLNETQVQLSILEEDLNKRSFLSFLPYVFILLIVLLVAVGIIYYLNQGKGLYSKSIKSSLSSKINPQTFAYITNFIKQGKKFPDIKQNLLKAGWLEEDIVAAYKATINYNYNQYLQKKSASRAVSGTTESKISSEKNDSPNKTVHAIKTGSGKQPLLGTFGGDKKKMYTIIGVTLLLVIAIFFILSGTIGRAIYTQKLVSEEGLISYQVECTPPQIMTPEGDACCTDANNNTLCDAAEREIEGLGAEGICTDNFQCTQGELCINSHCSLLSQIYQGNPACGKLCNYYTVIVLTSDGETYNLKPKKGSYTAAGAFEWKILEAPDHCIGEKAVIPIKIIRKDTGEIISEEVITLGKGARSQTLTHPRFPYFSFSLTIDKIYESCYEI